MHNHVAVIEDEPAFARLPLDAALQPLLRPEAALVPQRDASLDPVAQVDVGEAAAAGVKHIWMQPGAESDAAVRTAEALGMNVIAGGPCLLVVMGYHE